MQRNIGYRVYLVNYGGEGEKGREKERYRERDKREGRRKKGGRGEGREAEAVSSVGQTERGEKAGDPLALEIRGKIGNEQGLFLKGSGHSSDRPGQQICFYIF